MFITVKYSLYGIQQEISDAHLFRKSLNMTRRDRLHKVTQNSDKN